MEKLDDKGVLHSLSCAIEIAWNLREWVREASKDRTLQPALDTSRQRAAAIAKAEDQLDAAGI